MTAPEAARALEPKRRTVLITGAAGKIGRRIRRHLDGRYALRLVDLDPAGDPAVAAADLSQVEERWMGLFDGVDVAVHCAAASHPRVSWPQVARHNIDATLNVLEAATRAGARRVVFMSSSWTMAGYRFGTERLTTDLPTRPVNPYGISKVIGERLAHGYSLHRGLSVICLRIGLYLDEEESRPGPLTRQGRWGQQLWISHRDLCQLVERSIAARDIPFAILNGMSDNPGMRWDLEDARRLLGYVPQDGHVSEPTLRVRLRVAAARVAFRLQRLVW